jgi:hypothetical protein
MANLPDMGLILQFRAIPAPRRPDHAHHRLPTGMDVDVLHSDLLLAFAAVAVERFEERGKGAGELVRLGKVFTAAFGMLIGNHGTPIALHRRVVGGDQLRRHHAFELVLRTDASQSGKGGAQLLVSRLRAGVLQPKRLDCLAGKNVVPLVESRAAEVPERPLLPSTSLATTAIGAVSFAVFFPVMDMSAPVNSTCVRSARQRMLYTYHFRGEIYHESDTVRRRHGVGDHDDGGDGSFGSVGKCHFFGV